MTLRPEPALRPGDTVTSANGLYGVLDQGDGSLVLYGPDDEYVWESKIDNNPGSRLIMQDDGNMVIYRPDGSPAWVTETRVSPSKAAQVHVMQPGSGLNPTHGIKSTNGLYGLLYQGDGNLVLYGPDGPLWEAGTDGRGAGVCIMQADGNLVVYGPHNEYVWDSKTNNNPGSRLIIQDDGNIVIRRPDGSPVWVTGNPLNVPRVD